MVQEYSCVRARVLVLHGSKELLLLLGGGGARAGGDHDAGEGRAHNLSEEAGHDELISIIESQVKAKSPSELRLEAALQRFMTLVRERAQEAG
jgi:hypothetical protein